MSCGDFPAESRKELACGNHSPEWKDVSELHMSRERERESLRGVIPLVILNCINCIHGKMSPGKHRPCVIFTTRITNLSSAPPPPPPPTYF